ncbi:prepilin-type N-terminal cleavage/methylation domain-containing protein [Candidatus Daviesbacteria bacterium]|nr:prepilin-type N-terminal cleavage/methylation domain-containing protein [Candidatus Daviesbacteria bacterium]
MNKFLPKTAKNPHGFTLVELLVVISIIAILSVIGITVFGNVQQRARDARRKADIDSIAKAMEANYNTVTCVGTYCALADSFFANGKVPVDPINAGTTCSANSCKYCVRTAVGACAATDTTVAVGQPAAGATYIVCTSLETASGTGGNTYECRKNQQ